MNLHKHLTPSEGEAPSELYRHLGEEQIEGPETPIKATISNLQRHESGYD